MLILIPYIFTELWWSRSRKYFVILNTKYIHWVLMVSLKKLFNNFQYTIYALNFDGFGNKLFFIFQFQIYGMGFDDFAQEIILWILIPYIHVHWALVVSLKKLFCNFKYPIYALSLNRFDQEIIFLLFIPNISIELWWFP